MIFLLKKGEKNHQVTLNCSYTCKCLVSDEKCLNFNS